MVTLLIRWLAGPMELRPRGDGAELADDQLVPKRGVVEEDVTLLKLRGVFQVVVIGVVPHVDVGGSDDVFRKQDVLYSLGKTALGSGMSHMFRSSLVLWDGITSFLWDLPWLRPSWSVRRYCMESSLLEKMKVEKKG